MLHLYIPRRVLSIITKITNPAIVNPAAANLARKRTRMILPPFTQQRVQNIITKTVNRAIEMTTHSLYTLRGAQNIAIIIETTPTLPQCTPRRAQGIDIEIATQLLSARTAFLWPISRTINSLLSQLAAAKALIIIGDIVHAQADPRTIVRELAHRWLKMMRLLPRQHETEVLIITAIVQAGIIVVGTLQQ